MLWLLSMIRNTGCCYYHQPYVDEIEFFPKFFYYCHFLLIDDWWNMNKKETNKQTIWCDEQKDLKIVVFWHLVAMGVCVCWCWCDQKPETCFHFRAGPEKWCWWSDCILLLAGSQQRKKIEIKIEWWIKLEYSSHES